MKIDNAYTPAGYGSRNKKVGSELYKIQQNSFFAQGSVVYGRNLTQGAVCA